MSANLGALTVSLGLDAADYTRGLTKAEKQAYDFGESIGKGIRTAAEAAASALVALGASAGAAVAGFNSLIDGASKFADLADKTGASAEGLASFAVAAGTSGVQMDKIASATNMLTKNLVGVDDEAKAAGAALTALGIPIKDFKALAPEAQIEKLSKTFAEFESGANKTAVAMALFGRSGADVLPFLKTLEEQGGRQVILTQQQIDLADEYGDRQAKAKAELELYAQALSTQAIPYITAFTGALTDTIKEMLGVGKGATDLKNNTAIADFAENAVNALGFVIDAADGVARVFRVVGSSIGGAAAAASAAASGEFTAAKSILGDIGSEVDKILQVQTFGSKLKARIDEAKKAAAAGGSGAATPAGRALNYNGPTKSAGGGGDNATKKLLDNQLKEIDRAYKQEENLLQSRNKVLDLYYAQNLVSIEDYYASRQANQEEATSKEVALIDQQIAALEKYKAAAKKDTDRADAQGKINALLDKEADLQRKAGEVALEQSIKKVQAIQAYKDAIDGVRASLLEMQGDAGAAAQIRVEIQYRDLLTKATTQNDEAAKKLITSLKAQTVAQADFNAQAKSASQITAQLQIDEDRVAIARQLGTTGELESLQKLGESRRKAVVEMRAIVEAQEAIAKASGNKDLILQADQARVALEKLAATADPLADKFNTMFSDAAGSAFSDFITGAKTAKEAFKSFTDSIFKELTNLIVKDLFKQLFSGGGSGTGGVGFNFGSLLSGLFGGGKAIGGTAQANTLYQVAENRPEMLDVNGKSFLMMGNQRGNIDPNPSMSGGGMSVVINQSFAAGTSRQTTDQAAQQAGRAIERAQRRNG